MQVQAAGAPVNKYGYEPEDERMKSSGKKKKKWAKKVAVRLGDALGGVLSSPLFGNWWAIRLRHVLGSSTLSERLRRKWSIKFQ